MALPHESATNIWPNATLRRSLILPYLGQRPSKNFNRRKTSKNMYRHTVPTPAISDKQTEIFKFFPPPELQLLVISRPNICHHLSMTGPKLRAPLNSSAPHCCDACGGFERSPGMGYTTPRRLPLPSAVEELQTGPPIINLPRSKIFLIVRLDLLPSLAIRRFRSNTDGRCY